MGPAIRSNANRRVRRSSWFLVIELLFVVSLLSNFVIYGGIPSLPKVGPGLEKSVSKQTQILHLYMRGGEWLMGVPGLKSASHQVLNRALGPEGIKDIALEPSSGALILAERTYSFTHSLMHTLQWLTPVFFLLSVIGLLFRPKQVRSFR